MDEAEERAASARFRTALAMADGGVAMKRAQLGRDYPGESVGEILARLNLWLREDGEAIPEFRPSGRFSRPAP